jgi:hypothetical protein
MNKNKFELVDEAAYYRAFKSWLDSSNSFCDEKNDSQMNEYWLKFADEIGIYLGANNQNEKIMIEITDAQCWKEAKKYYSLISYRVSEEAVV